MPYRLSTELRRDRVKSRITSRCWSSGATGYLIQWIKSLNDWSLIMQICISEMRCAVLNLQWFRFAGEWSEPRITPVGCKVAIDWRVSPNFPSGCKPLLPRRVTQIPVYRARVPRRTSVISPTAVKVKHASFRVLLPLLPQRLRALTQSRHLVSRLSAAHPLQQAMSPRAGAGGDASNTDGAAPPPARRAIRIQDWPWPLHSWELSSPVWWQQMTYRHRRIY